MKKMIIAALSIVMLASCKKENVSPAPVPAAAKSLMSFTNVYNNSTPETETYTYDANGKIASINFGDYTETFDFVSKSSLIVTGRFNATNVLKTTKECTLNDKGYVTQIVVKNAANVLQGTYNYTYNAEGYMTAQQLVYPSGKVWDFEFVISDGNTVFVKIYQDKVLNNNSTIGYDKSIANKTRISYSSYWNVPGLFGKSSKNMMSEIKHSDPAGTVNFHVQYSYDLDAAGYPVKQNNNFLHSGKQGFYTYIYQ